MIVSVKNKTEKKKKKKPNTIPSSPIKSKNLPCFIVSCILDEKVQNLRSNLRKIKFGFHDDDEERDNDLAHSVQNLVQGPVQMIVRSTQSFTQFKL